MLDVPARSTGAQRPNHTRNIFFLPIDILVAGPVWGSPRGLRGRPGRPAARAHLLFAVLAACFAPHVVRHSRGRQQVPLVRRVDEDATAKRAATEHANGGDALAGLRHTGIAVEPLFTTHGDPRKTPS